MDLHALSHDDLQGLLDVAWLSDDMALVDAIQAVLDTRAVAAVA